jgi:filamentous hemagglutinin
VLQAFLGTLLNLVAGADIDAVDSAQLKAVLGTSGDSNPEKGRLQEDLQLAEGVINRLKNKKIQLTWADAAPIVAHGDGVYAFASTSAQYNDSNLLMRIKVIQPRGMILDLRYHMSQEDQLK